MKVPKGSWVQIHQIVLNPEERAPQVPDDTKQVPLELRVNGFLDQDAEIGKEVTITTLIGRKLTGYLRKENPRYEYDFGQPIPALLTIGQELRNFLFEEGRSK